MAVAAADFNEAGLTARLQIRIRQSAYLAWPAVKKVVFSF
jgi:hypothetical protein